MFILLLFVLSITMIVIGGNFFSALVGWDLLGVTSFLLVQFYNGQDSYEASLLTGLSNRFGDVFLMLRLAHTIGFSSCFLRMSEVMAVFLVIGAMTKRAQFPFRGWLPAAIIAPTPVSSLVHSSTLVTAGVFLLIRCDVFLGRSDLLLICSLITMNVAGLAATYEDDLKKVVAYSTLGHVSVITTAIRIGCHELAMFHCIVHAVSKAGLFIRVGNIMVGQEGSQDSREANWFSCRKESFSFISGILSSLVLIGVPPFSVGITKELVIQKCIECGSS